MANKINFVKLRLIRTFTMTNLAILLVWVWMYACWLERSCMRSCLPSKHDLNNWGCSYDAWKCTFIVGVSSLPQPILWACALPVFSLRECLICILRWFNTTGRYTLQQFIYERKKTNKEKLGKHPKSNSNEKHYLREWAVVNFITFMMVMRFF